MMRPENYVVGKLVIPINSFWAYAQTLLPPGHFYTMGQVVAKPEALEISYSASTEGMPPSPEDILTAKLGKDETDGT
jgi:hypothetical protein